jgi:hypothetical protein
MAKIEIDKCLLIRLAELAASAMNDTVSHSIIKEDTNACDNEINAASLMFLRLSDGCLEGLPENMTEFKEIIKALEIDDFENRFLG